MLNTEVSALYAWFHTMLMTPREIITVIIPFTDEEMEAWQALILAQPVPLWNAKKLQSLLRGLRYCNSSKNFAMKSSFYINVTVLHLIGITGYLSSVDYKHGSILDALRVPPHWFSQPSLRETLLLAPFYRCGDWGPESLSHSPKITQLQCSEAEILSQAEGREFGSGSEQSSPWVCLFLK